MTSAEPFFVVQQPDGLMAIFHGGEEHFLVYDLSPAEAREVARDGQGVLGQLFAEAPGDFLDLLGRQVAAWQCGPKGCAHVPLPPPAGVKSFTGADPWDSLMYQP